MGIGARLRQLREERQLSSAVVQAGTRISPRVLEAIERDDFGSLPGGIFTRGYLRAYARELDLDAEAVIAQYLAEHPPEPVDRREAPADRLPRRSQGAMRFRVPRAYVFVVFAVGGFLLLFHGWLGTFFQGAATVADPIGAPTTAGAPPTIPSLPTGPPERPAGSPTPSAAVMPASHGPGAPPPGDPVKLTLTATARVWVTADVDGERILYRHLESEERVDLAASSRIRVRVGDAGALLVALDGAAPVAAGPRGQVRTLQFTRDEIATAPAQ
jgi:hypothetical protein